MRNGAALSIRARAIATAAMLIPLTALASRAITSLDASRLALGSLSSDDKAAPASEARVKSLLIEHLRVVAKEHGVRLVRAAGATAVQGDLVIMPVDVTGTQAAVLAFIDALETGPRAIRFRNWRLQRLPGTIRLTGAGITPVRTWR